ncbi:MAG: N-formylglutamate amidohydrolase [Phycisphaerales bacterium]|nr:N-formylglutamate amidohydrolase [Phycisphaerales bacterium]
MTDNNESNSPDTVLTPDEPPPFYVMHAESTAPILLICDHASCRFPQALGNMGLDPFARRCHLAIDIGAGSLTEFLADSLGITAVLCQYSRLIVDCNRDLMDPGAFLEYGDGILVPGNRNLSPSDRNARANSIYWPYHRAIDTQVQRLIGLGTVPAFIAVHSFTPVLNGIAREWEIGVLWDKDTSLKELFINDFRAAGFHVGDNEPYSGKAPADYSVDNHAEALGLPCVGIEIRQDLVRDPAGVARIGHVMHRIIESIPKRINLQTQRISA